MVRRMEGRVESSILKCFAGKGKAGNAASQLGQTAFSVAHTCVSPPMPGHSTSTSHFFSCMAGFGTRFGIWE